MNNKEITTVEDISNLVYIIRDQRVMLDDDLFDGQDGGRRKLPYAFIEQVDILKSQFVASS